MSSKNKKRTGKKTKRYVPKREKKLMLTGFIIMGIFLLILWVTCLGNLFTGNLFGYENHYRQPVGTFILLAVLIVATPIGGYVAWKEYNGESLVKKSKAKNSKKRKRGKNKKKSNGESPFYHDPSSHDWHSDID